MALNSKKRFEILLCAFISRSDEAWAGEAVGWVDLSVRNGLAGLCIGDANSQDCFHKECPTQSIVISCHIPGQNTETYCRSRRNIVSDGWWRQDRKLLRADPTKRKCAHQPCTVMVGSHLLAAARIRA